MAHGWIKLHREVTDHWLWSDEPFTKGQAWIDLLLNANHAPAKAMIKGKLYRLDRGQQCRSMLTLSKDWQWSRGKVKRFLNLLESDAMIEVKTDTNTSLITICNYNDYQDDETTSDTTLNTSLEHQTDNTQDTNKNVKNNQEGEEKDPDLVRHDAEQGESRRRYQFSVNEMRFAEYMADRIKSVIPGFKRPSNLDRWANEVRLMRERDKRSLNEAWGVFEWANSNSFWAKNIQSPDKLRLHYARLEAEKHEQANKHSSGRVSADEERNAELLRRYGHAPSSDKRGDFGHDDSRLAEHKIQRGFSGEMEPKGATYDMDPGHFNSDG